MRKDNSSAIRYIHMQTGVRRCVIGDVLNASERYDWVHQVLTSTKGTYDGRSAAEALRDDQRTLFANAPSDTMRFLYVVRDTEHDEKAIRKVFDTWNRFKASPTV
jgi:gluconate kinase